MERDANIPNDDLLFPVGVSIDTWNGPGIIGRREAPIPHPGVSVGPDGVTTV